jgi:hypothetical protein
MAVSAEHRVEEIVMSAKITGNRQLIAAEAERFERLDLK